MDFSDISLALGLPLYELDGASFRSRDARGYPVTATGAVWTAPGRAFDGVDDLLTVPHSGAVKPDPYTIEAWVKPDTDVAIYRDIITSIQDNDGNLQGYHIRIDQTTGLVTARSGNGTQNTAIQGRAVNDNSWHHIAVVLDTANLSLYQEGNFVSQAARKAGAYYDTSDPRLGRQYGWFKGIMGEVRIYSRALTPLEIQRNYVATERRYR